MTTDMDVEFLKEVLSMPNPSGHEDFLSQTVAEWCGDNGIAVRRDGKGNLFLTKGHAQFFPCFTSHLDSVLDGTAAKQAVKDRTPLEIIQNGDKLTAKLDGKPCVIGCDCKNGIAIALSCMKRLRAAKAAFYVQEEIGCKGVQGSDMKFFEDCSFVIGLDSPEFNRAAKSCLGLPLFSDKFFAERLEPICSKHGLTDFRAEPGTDIFFIRKDANNNPDEPDSRIECINFGNGGYNEHSDREYASIQDVNKSESLAFDLAKSIGGKAWFSVPPKPEPPKWQAAPLTYSKDFWGGADERREARREKETTDLSQYAAIAFQFSDAGVYAEFMRGKVMDLGIEIESDDDESIVTMSGPLKEVQAAYVLAFNAEHGTNYSGFSEFSKTEDAVNDFWNDMYYAAPRQSEFAFDDIPPRPAVDRDEPSSAADDFWERMKRR